MAKLSETANCGKLQEAAKKAAADAEKDKAAATQAAKGKDEAKKTAAKDAAAKSQAAADEAQALYTEAKAAADLKAKEDAAVKVIPLKKKITLICTKGTLTKKVVAIKPVCPKGYKKK